MLTEGFLKDVREYVEGFGRKEMYFYDIEVYPHDSFIVLKDIHKNTVAYFHHSTGFDGLMEYVKDGILCGYNNYYYDDYVISAMLSHIPEQGNTNIKRVNDQIILGGGAEILINSHIVSNDCYQQIDVSRPSLKKIEANKGIDIEETPVDFNIDRPLTEKELEDAIFYCSYDVDQTIDIFIERFYSYYKPKQYVIGLLDKPSKNTYRWNTTTISANVVKPDFKRGTRHHQIQVPEETLSLVSDEVVDMWNTQEKGKISIEAFNNIVEFGFGGLHSVHKDKKVFDNVIVADFESLYPNIMINHNLLGEYTDNLKQLVKRRVEAKHKMAVLKKLDNRTPEQENEMNLLNQEQGALKLVINSVYGLLKNKYSSLFDPKISTTVCAIGQCYLFELGNRLSSCATIVQLNTDGVFFVPHDDRYKQICEEFAKEVSINLDYDDFKRVIQKDVNNYIGIKENDSLYLKGGDTNMYRKPNYYGTNTARICQIAVVNYLAYDEPVLDTILKHRDDPSLFQYVLQAGGTYKGTFDQHDKEYQKVNRIFATHLPNHVTLKKKRIDDGLVSFANAPEKMFVWNKDISELDGFEHIVDVGHYVKIANRMIELWEKPLV